VHRSKAFAAASWDLRVVRDLPAMTRSGWAAMVRSWSKRKSRLWLAWVAVPLAMNAAGLTDLWWLWLPLLGLAGLWSPSWRWNWVLTLQLGIVGTEWAYVGVSALVAWRTQRALVGTIWAASALAIAMASIANRRYQRLPERSIRM